jgi:hypothetical protein
MRRLKTLTLQQDSFLVSRRIWRLSFRNIYIATNYLICVHSMPHMKKEVQLLASSKVHLEL